MKACVWESTVRVTRTVFVSSTLISASACLTGCSLFFDSGDAAPTIVAETAGVQGDWLADGFIAIARPLPAPSTSLALRQSSESSSIATPVALDSSTLLGFMPLPPVHGAAWLAIDKVQQTVALMSGSSVVKIGTGEGLSNLKSGTYRIAHKQQNPLWHAPASYFEARGLPVPAEGDRARFRRGALGEMALFIDQETPIHSGPIWSSEIGGVKLDQELLTPLYEQLDVGAMIEVK